MQVVFCSWHRGSGLAGTLEANQCPRQQKQPEGSNRSHQGKPTLRLELEKGEKRREREKAVGGPEDGGPEDACVLCRHRHRNKECYRQHPELKRFKKKYGKGKEKSRGDFAIEGSDDSSDEDKGVSVSKLARGASASLTKNPLLYDTGASHYFVCCEKDFVHLRKLHKPFQFDQAVGTSRLMYQGVSRITIGSQTLDLEESFFSPNSTCTIISVGRLKKQHGIVAAESNKLLVRMKDIQPVARLKTIDHVLYIRPLKATNNLITLNNRAAPGVARIPHAIDGHRWHQRLGHTGQQILKKTAQSSSGMSGIDFTELTSCEICHLSKAQRFISREPRPVVRSVAEFQRLLLQHQLQK
ncbi:hypothetical protein K3495_g126 [Podosphaera aphanis]|nr:hypothetical protein K3495_g126 [Podosphaera aphanis]